jgi:hypothetical protein
MVGKIGSATSTSSAASPSSSSTIKSRPSSTLYIDKGYFGSDQSTTGFFYKAYNFCKRLYLRIYSWIQSLFHKTNCVWQYQDLTDEEWETFAKMVKEDSSSKEKVESFLALLSSKAEVETDTIVKAYEALPETTRACIEFYINPSPKKGDPFPKELIKENPHESFVKDALQEYFNMLDTDTDYEKITSSTSLSPPPLDNQPK